MRQELSFLPAWYGNKGDLVLTDDLNGYYDFLYNNFPDLPRSITQDYINLHSENEISIWGISPQSIHFFEELEDTYCVKLNKPAWIEKFSYLNSRQAAHEILISLSEGIPLIEKNIIPRFFTNLNEIDEYVNDSNTRLLAKAPYSSSGRGLLWLPQTGLTRTEKQILHGILKKQGCVSVERVLDKQTDFAMEFLCDGQGGIEFAGYSLFYTNDKGAYQSNYIGPQSEIEKMLEEKIPASLIEDTRHCLMKLLQEKYATIYKGCLGVDMMIYKEGNQFKLHPCIEINMRYNMGYLSLRLSENYIHPLSEGRFYLDFNPKEGNIYTDHLEKMNNHPLQINDGKIEEGYLSLCPVTENSKYRAYILIE